MSRDRLLDEVAPLALDKIGFTVTDPEAFAAYCAAKGRTPEQEMARIVAMTTPRRSDP